MCSDEQEKSNDTKLNKMIPYSVWRITKNVKQTRNKEDRKTRKQESGSRPTLKWRKRANK